jgi:isoaspartyl peptidase/L-asparaginase-like protein (Ntn-hydrolase superfamily)
MLSRAEQAAREAISRMSAELGEGLAGVVAVDVNGDVGYAFNTEAMTVAYRAAGMERAAALAPRKAERARASRGPGG